MDGCVSFLLLLVVVVVLEEEEEDEEDKGKAADVFVCVVAIHM